MTGRWTLRPTYADGSPRPPLALLSVAVLAVHIVVLRAAPAGVEKRDPNSAVSFITRTIQAAPPLEAPAVDVAVAPAPPPPQPTPAPAPAPAPAPRPKPPPPPPAPVAAAEVASAPAQVAPGPETLVPAPTAVFGPAPVAPPAPEAQSAQAPATGPAADSPLATSPFTVGPVATPRAAPAAGSGGGAASGDAALLAPSPPAAAYAVPGSMRLRYQVAAQTRGIDLKATAELVWRQDGKTYDARLETVVPLLPPRVQQSTGQITAEGLAPTRYGEKARNEEAAHFERDKARLTFSNNQPAAPLLAGAQDRLSVMLQLGALIGGAPARYPPGSTINVQTVGTRDAEVWQFTVEAEEELALPGGRQKALKLVRTPRKPFDQTVELWLAPGMDYVPVRVRLTQQNGDRLDQQWAGTDRP